MSFSENPLPVFIILLPMKVSQMRLWTYAWLLSSSAKKSLTSLPMSVVGAQNLTDNFVYVKDKTKVKQGRPMQELHSLINNESDFLAKRDNSLWVLEENFLIFLCYTQFNNYSHNTLCLIRKCLTFSPAFFKLIQSTRH